MLTAILHLAHICPRNLKHYKIQVTKPVLDITMQNPDLLSTRSLLPELDLKVYARLLWHWAWLVILCTVMAAAVAYAISSATTPIYQASTTLLINQARNPTGADMQDLMLSERIGRTYAELMKRSPILAKVAEEFEVEPAVLQSAITQISVTSVRDTQLLLLSIEGTSPEVVASVAETLPRVFIEELKSVQSERFAESKNNLQRELDTLSNEIEVSQVAIEAINNAPTAEEAVELGRLRNELTQYQNNYANLLQSYENIRLTEVQSSDNIVVVEPPQLPTQPIRPRVLTNTLLAAIVGAMLALGIIFLIEYLDDRIKTPQDLYSIVDLAVLGSIAHIAPQEKKGWGKRKARLTAEETLVASIQPRHPITEAYRGIRTNLQYSSVDTNLTSLVVTSATPGEGKTTTAANLAIVLAQSGRSVILVDADMRKPRQHALFELPQSPGLTDAIVASHTPPSRYVRATNVPNLSLLTSGKLPPNPAELLGSQRMQQLIAQLHEQAEMIIFDAPPVLAVTDAQVLANQVNGVVLIIDSEQTTRATVARAVEALTRTNANLLGAVLNRLVRSPRGYYQYDQYSAYYTEEAESSDPKRAKRSRNFLDEQLLTKPELNGAYQVQPEKSEP
jgi:polysaccharide biosynthesis transport protein